MSWLIKMLPIQKIMVLQKSFQPIVHTKNIVLRYYLLNYLAIYKTNFFSEILSMNVPSGYGMFLQKTNVDLSHIAHALLL